MRRFQIAAAIILLFAAVSRAQDAAVTVLTPRVEMGSVVPGSPQPSTALVSLNIVSGAPWRLAIRVDERRALAVTTHSVPNGLPIRLRAIAGGSRTEIPAEQPVTVLEGLPTPKEGTVVTIPFEADALWSASPSRDTIRLEILLDDQPSSAFAEFTFQIAPQINVVSDTRPYRLQVLDPTNPDTVWFEQRLYHVTSNTAWALSVKLKDDVRLPGSNRMLDAKAFVVRSSAGSAMPLGATTPVATGGPTGESGVDVEVVLGLHLSATEIGGAYSGSIAVDVVPAPDGALR